MSFFPSNESSSQANIESNDQFDDTNTIIARTEFFTLDEVEDFVKELNKRTEIWTLLARLNSIEKITYPNPKALQLGHLA